jgi:putative transposase
MPRLPRLHVPGGCYHVILRGNHREALFASDRDRIKLNEIVAEALGRHQARLHAFCWMTNHLHALIQIAEVPLGRLMHSIARPYSRYRHRQLRTTGHLFERRHKAWLVDVDAYFLTLLRYIHRNPVKAKMVDQPEDYRWSSHHAYLGSEVLPWLTTDFGLSLFGVTEAAARDSYRRFMAQPSYASEDAVLNDVHECDARVLGTDRFLDALRTAAFVPRSVLSLEELARQVCEQFDISLDAVRSTSRQRSLSAARVTIAMRALDERVACQAEVAAFLRREPGSLSELLRRHRR